MCKNIWIDASQKKTNWVIDPWKLCNTISLQEWQTKVANNWVQN